MEKVIVIKQNEIYIDIMKTEQIIKEYEIYCPIFKYNITICVKNNSGYGRSYINSIASDIYGGCLYGDVIIVIDEDEDDDINEVMNYIKIKEYLF